MVFEERSLSMVIASLQSISDESSLSKTLFVNSRVLCIYKLSIIEIPERSKMVVLSVFVISYICIMS